MSIKGDARTISIAAKESQSFEKFINGMGSRILETAVDSDRSKTFKKLKNEING